MIAGYHFHFDLFAFLNLVLYDINGSALCMIHGV